MGRNEDQNQKARDERREQILAQALRLFATNGLAATRIADIAAAVGISSGLLYHYYASKEEIFTELIGFAFERMNTAARGLEQLPLEPQEKLKLALDELLKRLESDEANSYYYLLTTVATISDALPAEARAIIKRESGVPYEIIGRIIRQGQQQGVFRDHDPEELATLFWTSIKGLALHRAALGPSFKAPSSDILLHMFA